MSDKAVSLKDRSRPEIGWKLPGRRSRLRRIKIAEGCFCRETRMEGAKTFLALIRDGAIEIIIQFLKILRGLYAIASGSVCMEHRQQDNL